MNRLRSLLNVERGEEIPVLLLFLYLGLALTSYLIIKAVRDALFLNRFSAMSLPYVYVAVAVVIGFVVSVYLRVSARVGLATLITRTLVFLMANILLLWWAAGVRWSPLAAVFYVWSSIFGIIVPTQVWTVANRVLDVRQAKRLFPLISSGGILGSVVGGLFAAAAVKRLGTNHLLLVLVPLLALCALAARVLIQKYAYSRSTIQPGVSAPARKRGAKSLWKPLVESKYLRLIASVLALSAIVTIVVDFQFKVVVQKSIQSRDQLTAFFGSFYALLNFVALALQVLAGSRLAEKFGLRVTLFILPTALVSGTLLLLTFPMRLWAALYLKGCDQTIRHSIDKSTVELLYLPVPQSQKTEAKAVVDMMVQRVADGVGGILLVVMTRVFGISFTGVSVFALALIAVWLGVAFRARTEYVDALRKNFTPGLGPLPQSVVSFVFNEKSLATLSSMLESKDEEVVLQAIDHVVALQQRIPEKLRWHPSARIRQKIIELARMSAQQLVEHAQQENSSAVGSSAIMRASQIFRPDRPSSALYSYLDHPELKIRLYALVCLAREGMDSRALEKHLSAIAAKIEETTGEWSGFIEALGEIRDRSVVEPYMRLLAHANPEVRRQAALSAGRPGHRELVPFLVRLLADPEVAGEARRALRECGPRILGTLADVMKDSREAVEIRGNIPRVLAYIPDQASVDILLEGLNESILADRCIRSLSKLRLLDASLRFDPAKIAARIRVECENALWYQRALTSLYPEGQGSDLLARLLKDKIEYGKDNVFRLLALILPPTTAHESFQVLRQDDRSKKANVTEYLDNVLPADLRKYVVPLVEVRRGAAGRQKNRWEVLEALLKSADPTLRECAASAIAQNR